MIASASQTAAIAICLAALWGCARVKADEAVVRGVSVSVLDSKGKCRLSAPALGVTMDLALPWPCSIHRGPDASVRVHTVGDAAILLVESSRKNPERPSSCITEIQAVRLSGKTLRASEHTDRVAACPPFQWDEVMFTGLFADR